jgi:hypothetical protein
MPSTSKPRPYKVKEQDARRRTDNVIDVSFREIEKKRTPWGYRLAQISVVFAVLFLGVVVYKFAQHQIEMQRFLSYMQKQYPPRPIPKH